MVKKKKNLEADVFNFVFVALKTILPLCLFMFS